jgi:hypothetical protein
VDLCQDRKIWRYQFITQLHGHLEDTYTAVDHCTGHLKLASHRHSAPILAFEMSWFQVIIDYIRQVEYPAGGFLPKSRIKSKYKTGERWYNGRKATPFGKIGVQPHTNMETTA